MILFWLLPAIIELIIILKNKDCLYTDEHEVIDFLDPDLVLLIMCILAFVPGLNILAIFSYFIEEDAADPK